jgi:hypothetical protein
MKAGQLRKRKRVLDLIKAHSAWYEASGGKPLRLTCGALYGTRSPAHAFSEMFWWLLL